MKVFKSQCANCLLTPDRIVSGKEAKAIINKCITEQRHFICHKASMKSEDVCCKTFYDRFGQHSQLIRIMERINAIKFIEHTDNDKLVPYKNQDKP